LSSRPIRVVRLNIETAILTTALSTNVANLTQHSASILQRIIFYRYQFRSRMFSVVFYLSSSFFEQSSNSNGLSHFLQSRIDTWAHCRLSLVHLGDCGAASDSELVCRVIPTGSRCLKVSKKQFVSFICLGRHASTMFWKSFCQPTLEENEGQHQINFSLFPH